MEHDNWLKPPTKCLNRWNGIVVSPVSRTNRSGFASMVRHKRRIFRNQVGQAQACQSTHQNQGWNRIDGQLRRFLPNVQHLIPIKISVTGNILNCMVFIHMFKVSDLLHLQHVIYVSHVSVLLKWNGGGGMVKVMKYRWNNGIAQFVGFTLLLSIWFGGKKRYSSIHGYRLTSSQPFTEVYLCRKGFSPHMGSSKIGVHPKSISSLYPWINFAFLGHPESWHKASQSQVYQVGCIMLYIPSHSHDVSILVHDWFTTFYNLIQVLNMIFPNFWRGNPCFMALPKKGAFAFTNHPGTNRQ